MLEIAITGIDGSGKEYISNRTMSEYRKKGYSVALLDVPYFHNVKTFPRLTKLGRVLWRLANRKQSSVLVIMAGVLSMMLYLVVRYHYRSVDLLVTKRHPVIECPVYGALYAGRFGACLGKIVHCLWPQPDMVYFIDIPVAIAYKRLCERGSIRQPHETPRQLSFLQYRLRCSVGKFRARQAVVDIDTTACFLLWSFNLFGWKKDFGALASSCSLF